MKKSNQDRQEDEVGYDEDDDDEEERPPKTRKRSMSSDDFDLIHPQQTVNDSTLVMKSEGSQSMRNIVDEEKILEQYTIHRMSSTTTVHPSIDIGRMVCESCLCNLPPMRKFSFPQQPDASKD
jgi:hypothetical protein